MLFRYMCIIAVCGINTPRGQHAERDGACQRTGQHTLWLRWGTGDTPERQVCWGTSAFEAPSFLLMQTRVTAVLQAQKKQRNVRLWSVRHFGRTGPNVVRFTFVNR